LRLLPLICVLFCLSGCQSGIRSAGSAFDRLQEEYSSSAGVSMTFSVTAFYGESVMEYALQYSGNGTEGICRALSPKSVEGLLMEVREEDGTLICGGTRLDMGIAGASGITPAGIGPVLWRMWSEGYGTQCRFETRDGIETLAVTLDDGSGILLETWFSRETKLPLCCTVMQTGTEVLSCVFDEVTIEGIGT
jgi:hypothetical protein